MNTETKKSPLEIVINALENNIWDKEAVEANNIINAAPILLNTIKSVKLFLNNEYEGSLEDINYILDQAISKAEGK